MKLIVKIAIDFEKPEHVIRTILSSRACATPSSTIAGNHIRMMESRNQWITSARRSRTTSRRVPSASRTLMRWRRPALLNQLLQHRGAKNQGIRVTSKAVQLDGRLTAAKVRDVLVNLYQRTGILFNHDSFVLMRKFEQWSCVQDDGYITNKATIKMEYIKYDLVIHELHGGPGCGLALRNRAAARQPLEPRDRLKDSVQHIRTRATRCKKTVEKEGMGMGRVEPTSRATFAVTLCSSRPPQPVNPMPVPVDPTPAPIDPTPAPVNPTPAPVDPAPTSDPNPCTRRPKHGLQHASGPCHPREAPQNAPIRGSPHSTGLQ
ncbi:hypothetical protein B0H14DRAFT_2627720 [Mycena olivaceomarginata]|nr:hypothetical protein B0H14DRAFT_2627720 [Mycena olivaceomarginata]